MAKIITLSFVAIAGLSGIVGCGGPDLRPRVAELTREREELLRERTSLEGRLSAAEAREAALQRSRSTKSEKSDLKLTDNLKSKGVSVRDRGGDTVIDLPSDVFFASGSSKLTPAGEKALSEVSSLVSKSYKGSMIRVEGHADSDPIRRSKSKYHCNWELSFERAHAVVHYLIDKAGFDAKNISADCFGDTQPLDPKNKSKNRRVEIVVAR
ncbi:MAG TPA: OmpA family protein [Planctomycetota bacterium]|nr:OmpA family protein [Planctomycetota bacterium]